MFATLLLLGCSLGAFKLLLYVVNPLGSCENVLVLSDVKLPLWVTFHTDLLWDCQHRKLGGKARTITRRGCLGRTILVV